MKVDRARSLSLFLYRYLSVGSSAVCCCFIIIAFSFLPVRQTIQQLRPPCINRGSSKFPSPTQPFISNSTSTQLAHDPHPIILWPGTNILCCLTTPTGDIAASDLDPPSPLILRRYCNCSTPHCKQSNCINVSLSTEGEELDELDPNRHYTLLF